MIGSLVLSYGTGTKFNQISLNTLAVNALVIAFYTAYFFITNEAVELLMALIAFGVIAVLELIYFLLYHWKAIKGIEKVIHE